VSGAFLPRLGNSATVHTDPWRQFDPCESRCLNYDGEERNGSHRGTVNFVGAVRGAGRPPSAGYCVLPPVTAVSRGTQGADGSARAGSSDAAGLPARRAPAAGPAGPHPGPRPAGRRPGPRPAGRRPGPPGRKADQAGQVARLEHPDAGPGRGGGHRRRCRCRPAGLPAGWAVFTIPLYPSPGQAASGPAVAHHTGDGWSIRLTVAHLSNLGAGRFVP
jgi:hypothetical protein